jgi:RNA polymerase sigma-B factor
MERSPVERHEGEESSRTARLLRAYHRNGDITAREQLIEVYLPLVRSFARRYSRGSGDYDDLYQVGCIGLMNAIDRFRPDRGDELAAFAVPNIAGEMRRYLRDRGPSVRLPRRVLDLRAGAVRAQSDLAARLGRAPTVAEVAAELGEDEQDIGLALDAGSLSQSYELGTEAPGSSEPLDAVEDRVFLSEAFRGLGEEERRILYLRFVRDLEAGDVARELGMSSRQLSRRTQAALQKLRGELERTSPAGEDAPGRRLPASSEKPKMAQMATSGTVGEDYAEQPYHIELVRQTGPGGGWTARVEELADCVAHGSTHDEAVLRVEQAMRSWIADARASGREVPKPRTQGTHSGRLLVRMPQSLHADLARAAEREEVSLNQFITSALASAIGWRRGQSAATGATRVSDSERRRVLTMNIVVLGLVALIAVALLVVELVQKL